MRRWVTIRELREWQRAYTAGASLATIAEQSGRRVSTVHRALRRSGTEMRVREHRRPGRSLAPQLHAFGESASAIAQRFGVSRRTVYRWLEAS